MRIKEINRAQEEKGNRHFKGKNVLFFLKPTLELQSCYCNFGTGGLEIHRWFSFGAVLMGAKEPVQSQTKRKVISLTRDTITADTDILYREGEKKL